MIQKMMETLLEPGRIRAFSFRNFVIAFSALILVHFAIVLHPTLDSSTRIALDDLLWIVTNSLATVALFYAAKVSSKPSRNRKAWFVLAISMLSFTLGDVLWAYYEINGWEAPIPSPSDIPYLLYYPLFLTGILLLPTQPMSQNERLKTLLDTGIVMIAGVVIFWNLLIGPTIAESVEGDMLENVVAVAYPVMDLVLLFAVIELILKRIRFKAESYLIFLAIGAGAGLVADVLFMNEVLWDTYVSGNVLDVTWLINYAFYGLAALRYVESTRPEIVSDQTGYSKYVWPFYIPYLWVAAAFAMLVWSHEHDQSLPFYSLGIAVGGIIGLVIIRQIITINENAKLFEGSLREISERKQAEEKVRRLNDELERRVAERTVQLETANRDLHKEIAERIKIDEALRESEDLFRTLVSNMLDGVIILDLEGKVIFTNNAAANLVGIRRPEDGVGMNVIELISPDYREAALADLNRIKAGSDSFQSEYKIRTLSGIEKWVEGLSKLIRFRGAPADLITIRDVTFRKHAEDELRRARDMLEERVHQRTAELEAKNAEMERFIYTVSHDLRSPLITINGFAGFLEQDIKDADPSKATADLKTIMGAVASMDQLLSETLELSRIGRVANPPVIVPFEEIVQDAIKLSSEKVRSRGVEISVASPLPLVNVDRMRIVEVMVNLIENSVKYIGDAENPKIEIGYRPDGGKPAFFVKDNGMGVDPSQHDKIFGLFYKIDKKSSGTGAGLAIVKRIIEFHGGHIWIESELGKGARVCFTIPLADSLHEQQSKEIKGEGEERVGGEGG